MYYFFYVNIITAFWGLFTIILNKLIMLMEISWHTSYRWKLFWKIKLKVFKEMMNERITIIYGYKLWRYTHSWLYCFTNPLEIGTRVSLSHLLHPGRKGFRLNLLEHLEIRRGLKTGKFVTNDQTIFDSSILVSPLL